MKNKITKIWRKKSFWLALAIGILALSWFFGADTAAAQAQPAAADEGAAIYKSFIELALLLQQLLNRILWPILFMIGGLMNNDLLFNHGMETRLLAIWVQIRNIVNIVFVVAMVGIALYNVLGIGGEGDQFSLKSVLPKLIVAIVAVNFSYIAIKVMLDAVNVVTTAVFALPESVEQGLSNPYKDATERKIYEKTICTELYGKKGATVEKVKEALDKGGITDKSAEEVLKSKYLCDGVSFNKAANEFFNEYNSKNAALIMAVTMSKVAFIDKAALNSAGSFTQVSLNVLFSLILYFVYVTSFLALFIILVARLIVLWLGVALSPFLMLSIAAPGNLKEQLGIFEKIKFMKHAFVPLQIAFPMTIGYMMLKAFQGIQFADPGIDAKASLLETGTLDIGLATSGISTLQELIIAIAAIGVVWVGVFEAANGTIAEGVVGTLKEGVQGLGKFVGTAPFRYIPWIPVKTAEGEKIQLTPASLLETGRDLSSYFDNKQREKARKLFPFLQGMGSPSDFERVSTQPEFESAVKGNLHGLRNKDAKTYAGLREALNRKGRDFRYEDPATQTAYEKMRKAARTWDGKGEVPPELRTATDEFIRASKLDKPSTPIGTETAAATGASLATGGALTAKSVNKFVEDNGGEAKVKQMIEHLPEDMKNAAQKILDNKDDDKELQRIGVEKSQIEKLSDTLHQLNNARSGAAGLKAEAEDSDVNKAALVIKSAVDGATIDQAQKDALAGRLIDDAPDGVKTKLRESYTRLSQPAAPAQPSPPARREPEPEEPRRDEDEE